MEEASTDRLIISGSRSHKNEAVIFDRIKSALSHGIQPNGTKSLSNKSTFVTSHGNTCAVYKFKAFTLK